MNSEIHHYKQEDDLHFDMVKVNRADMSAWRDFLGQRSSFQSSYQGNALVIKNFDKGKYAFFDRLDYHDQGLTDVLCCLCFQ